MRRGGGEDGCSKNLRVRRANAEEAEEREGWGQRAPQHKPLSAADVPGEGAQLPRGCFSSSLCISGAATGSASLRTRRAAGRK